MFSNIGTTEILLVLLLVLVFFGAKKIPELAQGIGKGIKEFRKSMKEVQEDASGQKRQITENKASSEKP